MRNHFLNIDRRFFVDWVDDFWVRILFFVKDIWRIYVMVDRWSWVIYVGGVLCFQYMYVIKCEYVVKMVIFEGKEDVINFLSDFGSKYTFLWLLCLWICVFVKSAWLKCVRSRFMSYLRKLYKHAFSTDFDDFCDYWVVFYM